MDRVLEDTKSNRNIFFSIFSLPRRLHHIPAPITDGQQRQFLPSMMIFKIPSGDLIPFQDREGGRIM